MKTGWAGLNEDDGWSTEGHQILAPENLERVQRVLEDQGPVILEHRHYRGATSPDRFVFENYEGFHAYLLTKCLAGDSIYVWNFAEVCKHDKSLAHGKCPDDQGRVPRRGAY